MTMVDSCAIAVVLDRSGSMEAIRQATIDGFNEFLTAQKALPGQATLTLAQFDDIYEVVHASTPLFLVPPLSSDTFVPRGSTALLDAIGRTITALGARLAAMPERERPGRVLVTIITDGLENASREFTRERIFDMITHQREKYSWEFIFLAAGQDAIAVGEQYGIQRVYAASFSRSLGSARRAFRSASDLVRSARSLPDDFEAGFSDEQRAAMMDDADLDLPDSAPKPPRHPKRRKRKSGSSGSAQAS
jgi:hypothetical protein